MAGRPSKVTLSIRRMAVRYPVAMLVAIVMTSLSAAPAGAQQSPFRFQEATIAGIHAAFASGELTCVQLVRLYLDRIAAYDRQGPSLNAIITVNPRALETAAEMDRSYRANPASAGALHCIPIILKDNFNTFDMPTSGGNVSMKTSTPPADAFTVARMRKAGALILAKANMQEFARGGMSISSLGGQVHNPYDLGRTPGGSSGGTGASIAANFAVLGTGSDTGQSIRSPASANNLVGIRATRGLVEPCRRHSQQPDPGRDRPDCAHGDRRRAPARRHGGLRPGRSHHRLRRRAQARELHAVAAHGCTQRRAHRRDGEPVRQGRAPRRGQPRDGRRDRADGGARRHHRAIRPAGLRHARADRVDVAIRGADGDGPLFRSARSERADHELRRRWSPPKPRQCSRPSKPRSRSSTA